MPTRLNENSIWAMVSNEFMVQRTLPYRIARAAVIAGTAILLLVAGLIQIQQRLLHFRAERLLADVHRIRLYESNWSDAQALMKRWGAWGRYHGNCSAESCRYEIALGDASHNLKSPASPTMERIAGFGLRVYRWFSGRFAAIQVQFVVQDGRIWRTSTSVAVEVPPRRESPEGGYLLIVRTRASQSLREFAGSDWISGADEQLAVHPYYKAGRPSGCANCEAVMVTYTPRTPQPEIERLTSFDFSCLSRRRACTNVAELLPAAKGWHLWDGVGSQYEQNATMPEPCTVPVWTRGRDASLILLVDAISSSTQEGIGYANEKSRVRVVGSMKGLSPWKPGTVLSAHTFAGDFINRPFRAPEGLERGKRYIVFPIGNDSIKQGSRATEVYMPRCGVLQDTPEVRQELKRGFAENDALRGPELTTAGFPFR